MSRRWRAALVVALAALASIVCFTATHGANAQSAQAPANVAVTAADGRDYQQPSLALDPTHPSHLALAYQDGGQHQLCGLALSQDRGATWSARSLVGDGGAMAVPESFAACWNPSVAYDGAGVLYYVFQTSLLPSNPYSHVMITVSRDGGHTFTAPHAVDPASPEYASMRAGGDWWPQMAVDQKRGVVYVTWSRFTPELDSSWILLASSNDGGATFSTPLRLSGSLEKDVTGSEPAIGPDGTLFVAWLDYTSSERGLVACVPDPNDECGDWGRSSFALSTADMEAGLLTFYHDVGARFDFTQGLGCENYVSPGLMKPSPLNFYTVIERGGDCTQPGVVRAATSSDSGRTAQEVSTPASTVDTGCTTLGYAERLPPSPTDHACSPTHYSLFDHNVVSAVAGTSPGELLASWWDSEGDEAQGPSRVSLSLSLDRGQHWRTTAAVGAAGQPVNMQHRPAITIAPDGRLDLVYYDLTPGGAQDVYAVSAEDARHDLRAPVRVSARSASALVGPMTDDNRVSFGDHLAAVSSNDATYVAWTGTRANHQLITFARVPATLAGTTVSRGGWSIGVLAAVGVAVLAVLGLVGALWLRTTRQSQTRTPAVGSREESPS